MKNDKSVSRKKFLARGIGFGSLLLLPSVLWGRKDKTVTTGKKVKMLTPDGKLVEVDEGVLKSAAKQKATNKDIFNWIKNPSEK